MGLEARQSSVCECPEGTPYTFRLIPGTKRSRGAVCDRCDRYVPLTLDRPANPSSILLARLERLEAVAAAQQAALQSALALVPLPRDAPRPRHLRLLP